MRIGHSRRTMYHAGVKYANTYNTMIHDKMLLSSPRIEAVCVSSDADLPAQPYVL